MPDSKVEFHWAIIFDPGETVEVLHRLLEVASLRIVLAKPDAPKHLVPLAILSNARLCALDVILADPSTSAGLRIHYRGKPGPDIYPVLAEVGQSPVASLPAEVEGLVLQAKDKSSMASLDDDEPRFWNYSPGDWVYQLRESYRALVEAQEDVWVRNGSKGPKPTSVQSWMTSIVESLPAVEAS